MTWTGTDGSVWDLLNGTRGIRLLTGGTRGLGMPPIRRHTTRSLAVNGSRWRGKTIDERSVFWPIMIYSDEGARQWFDSDSAWWRSLHPDRVGTWEVQTPVSGRRILSCRFVDDSDYSSDEDPAAKGLEVHGVRLVAEQPLWVGQTVLATWGQGEQRAFFPGPPFWIGSSHTISNAKISNPGDEPGFVIWQVIGPATSATLGTAGRTISVPFAVPDGQTLTVDTSPWAMSAIDSQGVDKTGLLGQSSFAPVPPGEQIPLTLQLSGAGKVAASLVPLHHRAWG